MTRRTMPARLSARANEPPIRPQPITPSCSNIRYLYLVGVDRISAEQLEERARLVQLPEREGDVGLVGMAVEVDVEVVLPLTRARRPRLEACHRHAVRLQGLHHVVDGARPVRDRDDEAGAVVPRRLGLR